MPRKTKKGVLQHAIFGLKTWANIQHGFIFFSILFGLLAAVMTTAHKALHLPQWVIWIAFAMLFNFMSRYKGMGFFTKIAIVSIIYIAVFALLGLNEREAIRESFEKRFKTLGDFVKFLVEIFFGAFMFWLLAHVKR